MKLITLKRIEKATDFTRNQVVLDVSVPMFLNKTELREYIKTNTEDGEFLPDDMEFFPYEEMIWHNPDENQYFYRASIIIRNISQYLRSKDVKLQTLATLIHNKQCYLCHINQCGWDYNDWNNPNAAAQEYLKKASELLHLMNDDWEKCKAVVNTL